MFNDQVRLYGKHAAILKKYSKEKQGEMQFPFNIGNNIGDKVDSYIFENMFECYVFAASLGLAAQKKAEFDNDNKTYASIFADKINHNHAFLMQILTQMVIADETIFGNDIDMKIKLLYCNPNLTDEQEKTMTELFNSYVRGGLELLDDYLKDALSYEYVYKAFLRLMRDYDLI